MKAGLQVGDKIRVSLGFPFSHVGIYIGQHGRMKHAVVHNDKLGGVRISHIEEFSNGREVAIDVRVRGTWFDRRRIVHRALSLVGTKYDLVDFNCEHYVSVVFTGRAESPQLQAIALGILIVFGVALLSRE